MSNVNEFASAFQYRDCFVTDLKIENGILTLGDDADLQTDVKVSASGQEPENENVEWLGRVQLELNGKMAAKSNDSAVCAYHMVICGDFSAPSSMERERFVKMLFMNGTSTIYNIARAKLETISTMVMSSGKITLPMLNVVELLKKQLAEQSKTEPADNRPEADQD